MKKPTTLLTLSVTALLLAGCVYDAPLTDEHPIPIDSAILGIWEDVPEAGEKPDDELMMVLKYSETEYLIHYPIGDEGIYFRGYPIKIGDVSCVQLEVIGIGDDPLDSEEEDGKCIFTGEPSRTRAVFAKAY